MTGEKEHRFGFTFEHGPECEGCQRLRDVVLDALVSTRRQEAAEFGKEAS